ncbi:hypothetical protein [Halovenus salina]|uniref:Uncharacterized protein n=1 Tax=Halovenus salina TaxID=1510225 RepID=A0ABD5W6L9_9EURY
MAVTRGDWKAVFQLRGDRRAELLYLLHIMTRQRGETRTQRNEDASLDEIPMPLLAAMQEDDVIPIEEVSR